MIIERKVLILCLVLLELGIYIFHNFCFWVDIVKTQTHEIARRSVYDMSKVNLNLREW